MQIVKTTKQSLLNIILFTLIVGVYSLNAQVINYNEVNAYGWGQGMDEAVPVLCDLDGDNYIDMLVGTVNGKIWHLKQAEGNEFTIISRNFSNIMVDRDAYPAITDINKNGLIDLVIGSKDNIEWYEQQSANSLIFELQSSSLISVDPGNSLSPALIDINGDGLLEMVVGQGYGLLYLFEQDSINAGTFSLIDSSWMDVDIGWNARPFFTDLNDDGLLDLLVGEGYGTIFHFVQDSQNSMNFHQVTNNFASIDPGIHAAPCVLDIDNDDKLDLFVGEFYTGIYHYEQTSPASADWIFVSDQALSIRDFGYKIGFTIYDIDGDGLLDMLVNANTGKDINYIEHYEQEETGSLNFILVDEQFNDIEIWQYYNLAIYDINRNGLIDLFVSNNSGHIRRYEQDELDSYNFSLINEEFFYTFEISSPHLTFSDMDGDSLIDMVIGDLNGRVLYYEQDSLNAISFSKNEGMLFNVWPQQYATPQFTDIDGDALLDIIVGDDSGVLHYYEQDSVHSTTYSLVADNFASVNFGARLIPRFADINQDGQTDMLIAEDYGGISLYLRNDDMDTTPPDVPTNLSAVVDGNYVNLSWSACTAEDLALYNIYRGVRNDTTVAEYINSAKKSVTTYTDSSLKVSGTYFYWVTALDLLGNESSFSNADSMSITIVGIKDIQESILNDFVLYQNYPNPFNPETTIRYTVRAQDLVPQRVELSIYNTLGQKVATLVSKKQPAGSYQVKWNASGLSSGVYLYHLQAGEHVQTKKMIFMK